MSEGPAFIRADAVATIIGCTSTYAFLRQRRLLEEREFFPMPLATSRRPLLWRRDAVTQWQRQQGLPRDLQVALPQVDPDGGSLLARARVA